MKRRGGRVFAPAAEDFSHPRTHPAARDDSYLTSTTKPFLNRTLPHRFYRPRTMEFHATRISQTALDPASPAAPRLPGLP